MLQSPLPTFSGRLREAVLPAHRRIESLPFFTALSGRTLSTERYVDQLRAMAIVEATLDRASSTAKDPAVRLARAASTPRSSLILADLASFDGQGSLPDDPAPAAAALALAGDLLRCAAQRPLELVGYLYVLQGMSLGNLVHRADARSSAGPGGTTWYDGSGEETGPRFRRFCEALDSLALDGEAEAAVIAAAASAVASLEKIHAALDPALRPQRRFLATTFNAEAGTHQVPSDLAETAAALRAGERCLAEFPYFLERWGERGHRYTRSDVAWLASLAQLEPAEAVGQVHWLAGVLARRGMPTLLLERQLLLLEEELRAGGTSPRDWGFLGTAARALAARRHAALPDDVAGQLAASFLAAAGHGSEAGRLSAARLLLAAVADEVTGLPGTIGSLTTWYLAPAFPASWAGAVEALLREAFTAAGPRAAGV